jgi:uncharacterized Zn-binding protein involved in type VI secretion
MGMPACTITSQTAHGGIVTVGFPQVLIGFLPASRIGDLHVCPMVTGVVPHVGGPFILGSPTVLVGGMPQSRVTDQLTCVGPPDVAVMGCETVLVGMAGGGGAAAVVTGMNAVGASAPMNAQSQSSSQSSNQPTCEVQSDGTVRTSAPPGQSLPPIQLQSPGHPDLPASQTPNFQSVQPVTLPPNTTLYSVTDSQAAGPGSLWTPSLPADRDAYRQGMAVSEDASDLGQVVTATVPQEGLKAWMGTAASRGKHPGGAVQVYVPPRKQGRGD